MSFWERSTYRLVRRMREIDRAGEPGVIEEWRRGILRWAENGTGPDAEAARAWLPLWQVRPLYTAAELAPIFPVLAFTLGMVKKIEPAKSPAILSRELHYAGLPVRYVLAREYFIVENFRRWCNADDAELEELLR